jgi:hypothetical protein
MKLKHPQKYAEVAKRNPVLTHWQWRQIMSHEIRAANPESFTRS